MILRYFRLSILLFGLFCFSSYVFSAKLIVQPVDQNNIYECPFDVDVYVDAQGENVVGASFRILLNSGLVLKGYSFGEVFNLGFPIQYENNELFAYGFKFPGIFTGMVKLATLRLQQNTRDVQSNQLQFKRSGKPDTLDNVDVYYFGGADALTAIENSSFSFQEGDCPLLSTLSGDQLASNYDRNAHLMSLYKMIDEYSQKKNQSSFLSWILSNIYVLVSLFLFIVLVLLLWFLYKKGIFKRFFKHNSSKNA